MKKIISLFLILCFTMLLPIQAFAVSLDDLPMQSISKIAHIAYVEDVNSTGSNISTENPNENYMSENAIINVSTEGEVSVSIIINNEVISFVGVPIARTESGKSIFFEGTSSNAKYELVDFTYVFDVSVTNMFFVNTKNDYDDLQTMLKIYIKDTNSQTRDYYFIEIFDVNLSIGNEIVSSIEINSLIGSWVTREFEAASTDFGEVTNLPTPRATTSTRTWFCKKTFFNMADEQSHVIYWSSIIDFSSVPVGQEVNQYYRLTVTRKETTSTLNTDLNSSTQSCLHINGIELCQTSRPYTAWKSTRIDGMVQDNSDEGSLLSASIGISLGLISVSLSIPNDFTVVRTIDIDEIYTGYVNGVNGNYTRSISTTMNSDFALTQIGYYFEVISTLRDYGNTARTGSTMFATWHIDIINALTLDTYGYTCSHNVIVSIV